MITLLVNGNNPLSQSFYNELIDDLQLCQLTCPVCNSTGQFVVHAYYKRKVRFNDQTSSIRIQRIKCHSCSRTQALLTSHMVPYSQISLSTQVEVIKESISNTTYSSMEAHLGISLYCINHIISMFHKYWRQMVLIAKLDLSDLRELSFASFSNYSLQFMQIRYVSNTLFVNTT